MLGGTSQNSWIVPTVKLGVNKQVFLSLASPGLLICPLFMVDVMIFELRHIKWYFLHSCPIRIYITLIYRHSTMHEENKKYQCPSCTFSTRLSSHLKRHMRLHTGAKPFACPHCNYRCNNLVSNYRFYYTRSTGEDAASHGVCVFIGQFMGMRVNYEQLYLVVAYSFWLSFYSIIKYFIDAFLMFGSFSSKRLKQLKAKNVLLLQLILIVLSNYRKI